MDTLNRQRANIVLSEVLETGVVLSPEQAARKERVFERDGLLRWRASSVIGHCRIGCSFADLLGSIGRRDPRTHSVKALPITAAEFTQAFEQEEYLVWFDVQRQRATIVLKSTATVESQLKAWSHALLMARTMQKEKAAGAGQIIDGRTTLAVLQRTLLELNKRFKTHLQQLQTAGWDTGTLALETSPGRRLAPFDGSKDSMIESNL